MLLSGEYAPMSEQKSLVLNVEALGKSEKEEQS